MILKCLENIENIRLIYNNYKNRLIDFLGLIIRLISKQLVVYLLIHFF